MLRQSSRPERERQREMVKVMSVIIVVFCPAVVSRARDRESEDVQEFTHNVRVRKMVER